MHAYSTVQQLSFALKALEIARDGAVSIQLADVLTRVATLQFEVQRSNLVLAERNYETVLANLNEALSIEQALDGVDHEVTRKLHVMIGDVYVEQAVNSEPELLNQALCHYQQAHSAAQRNIVNNVLNEVKFTAARVASVLQQLGRYEDAFWLSKTTEAIDRLAEAAKAAAIAAQRVTPPTPQLKRVEEQAPQQKPKTW